MQPSVPKSKVLGYPQFWIFDKDHGEFTERAPPAHQKTCLTHEKITMNLESGNWRPGIGRRSPEAEKWHPNPKRMEPKSGGAGPRYCEDPFLPCGPERRGRTLVLRGTLAAAGQNGGAGPRYCEGPSRLRAGTEGPDPGIARALFPSAGRKG